MTTLLRCKHTRLAARLKAPEAMERGAPARPARSQSIESLVAQAENFHFNPNIPFKHWTRAADRLHQEVRATAP